jgi:hypothetical protein
MSNIAGSEHTCATNAFTPGGRRRVGVDHLCAVSSAHRRAHRFHVSASTSRAVEPHDAI